MTDWREKKLQHIRELITQAVPEVVEDIKWRKPSNPAGVPVWSYFGIICTGESYKDKLKLTFAQGAKLADPNGLFNGNDNGHTRRSIDIREDYHIDEVAFKNLIRSAIEFNQKNGS